MQDYILYGYVENNGKMAMHHISNIGGRFIGFVDRDTKKQCIKDVHHPQFIGEHPDAIIVIMSDHIKDIATYIRQNNWTNDIKVWPHMMNSYINYKDDRIDWLLKHTKTIYELYENDIYSQRLLMEMLAERSMKQFDFIELERLIDFSHNDLYFYDEVLAPRKPFTLINCGAYTGDSIYLMHNNYLDKMVKVYCFEPDDINFNILNCNLKTWNIFDKVVAYNCALSNHKSTIRFHQNSIKSCASIDGEKIVSACVGDDVVGKISGQLCINMDIEGGELDAIDGFKRHIANYNPYMAICVYHRFDDIWQIPLKLLSINDNYKFYLRCGVHMECYAVPNTHWQI